MIHVLLKKPVWQMNGEELLRGLCELLGCSRTTANKIKHDPRLRGCYSQAGKKIVFDAEKVLKALGRE